MPRMTLIDYCKQNGFTSVSKVRANSNGYKYVTCLDKNDTNNLINVYLGVRFAELTPVDTILVLADMYVTETTNDAGEIRLKLTDKSGELGADKAAEYQDI